MAIRKIKRTFTDSRPDPEKQRDFPAEGRRALCLDRAKRMFGRHAYDGSTAMFIKSRDRNNWAVFHMPCYDHYWYITVLKDERVVEIAVGGKENFKPVQYATDALLNTAIDDPENRVSIKIYKNSTYWLSDWMESSAHLL